MIYSKKTMQKIMIAFAAMLTTLAALAPCAHAQEPLAQSGGTQESPSMKPSAEQQDAADAADDEFKMVDYPIAIIPFKTRGNEVVGMEQKATDLLFANLVVDPALLLVEREDLEAVLGEAELNLSGIVRTQDAVQVGQLTGARLLITGSVFQVDEALYLVVKIIGTETSRVVGVSVKADGDESLDSMVERLSRDTIDTIKQRSDSLVAEVVDKADRIAAIKKKLAGKELPSVYVSVEEHHVGKKTIDPAAQTELILILKECGFTVIDPDAGKPQQADFVVKGEGFSEFATRTGNLVSVKSRLEIKIVDRKTDEIIAIDRQTRLAVDLGENIASKEALQQCAADIAERILYKLVDQGE